MERWTSAQSGSNSKTRDTAKASSNGSTGSWQSKKLTLTLKRKGEYMSGSNDEEDHEAQNRGAQNGEREVIDLVTPSPAPPALPALPALQSSNSGSNTGSNTGSSSVAQQSTQPTSLNTTESAKNSTSSSRPRKKAKLVLDPFYNSDDERDHPTLTSAAAATNDEEEKDEKDELDYLFHAEWDKLTDADEEDADMDAEGGYEASPPLDDKFYATALSREKYPQVFEIADMVHACNGCCTNQDVMLPSIEAPGAVDRQGAIHDLMEYLFDAAYEEGGEPDGYVKWEVEVFRHANMGCCEGADGSDDCGDLTGTLDIASMRSVHGGTVEGSFPDYDNPRRRNEKTAYLCKRGSKWTEVNLRATQEEIRWVEAADGGVDMVIPEGSEGFELAKQKARAALMGWVKEESGGVVVFIDGRDVKVFIKESVEDESDEIEEMSAEEYEEERKERAKEEKRRQMEEIHQHMREYEARMKNSLVDEHGKPLYYRDGKPLRFSGGKGRTAKEEDKGEWEM